MYIYIYIYIFICIYQTNTHRNTNIYKCRYTYAHIHIICCSGSKNYTFSFLIESISCSMGRSQYKKFCLSNVSFAKCIFTFTKFISLAHATMLGKFKNLIRIIRTNVIDKIKGYRIYALVNPFTGR